MGPIEQKMENLEHEQLLADPNVVTALNDIMNELARAERKHPIWPEDTIHQVAIMMEEAGEAVQAANDLLYGDPGADLMFRADLHRELVHTGAMCLRCLMHL